MGTACWCGELKETVCVQRKHLWYMKLELALGKHMRKLWCCLCLICDFICYWVSGIRHSCFCGYFDSASLRIIKVRSEFLLRSNLSKQIAQILCSNHGKVLLMLFPVKKMKPTVFKISLAELPAQLLRDNPQLRLGKLSALKS